MAKRKDHRVIIHFDYDCFYASVFEAENPTLKCLPLAVQQKQIIVTCNYEARRRGLRKLQLITDAKRTCPEVVIVLGEDLTRFRDASKILYKLLESYSWNKKVERLGFDEVFMDVTDIVDYNQDLLNTNDLSDSFFHLVKDDPTQGFPFDATQISGHSYSTTLPTEADDRHLYIRLILGSHLACHLRHNLEEEKGYTSTVGISTTKLVAKLVGNLHKPKGQTTLLPPYLISKNSHNHESNITTFIDSHDIGKIPGIGFKTAHLIRNHILCRSAEFNEGLIYGGTKENVTVRDVRLSPGMGPELLEKLLGGKPGAERGIGGKVWNLINGIDNTEVKDAKSVPSQISIEDSYIKLDTFAQVVNELRVLATSLIRRMHMDLVEDDDQDIIGNQQDEMNPWKASDQQLPVNRKWIAHPKTLRLSTRPRPPLNPDGTRTRSFNRISRSAPLPTFVFNLRESVDAIVEKLISESLLPMFRKLHPEKAGWNLSLVNICVANMAETAGDGRGGGRDIGMMFKRQEVMLKEWKIEDKDVPPDGHDHETNDLKQHNGFALENEQEWARTDGNSLAEIRPPIEVGKFEDAEAEPSAGNDAFDTRFTPTHHSGIGSEDQLHPYDSDIDDEDVESDSGLGWDNEGRRCGICGLHLPDFAMAAHERFHGLAEDAE